MKPNPLVGMQECVDAIEAHFRACERERYYQTTINDRAIFNAFRIAYTRLRHSGRERRHYVHYLKDNGLWMRIERRFRDVR